MFRNRGYVEPKAIFDDPCPATKSDEIEATWELHRLPARIVIAIRRRRWLAAHLKDQGNRCKYCWTKISQEPDPRTCRATIDHVVATSRGGADEFANTVAACDICNVAKSDSDVDAFLRSEALRRRIAAVVRPPNRLSVDRRSKFYDEYILSFGVGIRLNDRERTDVVEYCVSERWIKVRVRGAKDRCGNDLILKLDGAVSPYLRRTP